MAKPLSELRKKLSPEVVAYAERRKNEILLEMSLQELRQNVAGMTQNQVAALLDVTQAHVSKLEGRGDMKVSSLFGMIGALGGEVDLIARIHDAEYRISNFDEFRTRLGVEVFQQEKALHEETLHEEQI